MITRDLLVDFGALLEERNLSIEVTAAGGAALHLLEITTRNTVDLDVVDPQSIPTPVLLAAMDFAHDKSRGLDVGWLNSAASIFTNKLPKGWQDRATIALETPGLCVRTLAREDLLKLKTYALCQRGQDLQDCVALRPSPEELEETLSWLKGLQRGQGWAQDLAVGMKLLARELAKSEKVRERDEDLEPEQD